MRPPVELGEATAPSLLDGALALAPPARRCGWSARSTERMPRW